MSSGSDIESPEVAYSNAFTMLQRLNYLLNSGIKNFLNDLSFEAGFSDNIRNELLFVHKIPHFIRNVIHGSIRKEHGYYTTASYLNQCSISFNSEILYEFFNYGRNLCSRTFCALAIASQRAAGLFSCNPRNPTEQAGGRMALT